MGDCKGPTTMASSPLIYHMYTVKFFLCEVNAFIAGDCVLCCFTSEFTYKVNKITYKTDKNTNIFVILLVLFVILLTLFVNSLLKQQSTAMQAVISHEHF
jgi:hypothetical protein